MSYGIRLVALMNGRAEMPGVAGRWLKAYDPSAFGGRGDLAVTDDPSEALRLPSKAAAHELWTATAEPPYHRRHDGKPNRPLTAWTVSIEPLP